MRPADLSVRADHDNDGTGYFDADIGGIQVGGNIYTNGSVYADHGADGIGSFYDAYVELNAP